MFKLNGFKIHLKSMRSFYKLLAFMDHEGGRRMFILKTVSQSLFLKRGTLYFLCFLSALFFIVQGEQASASVSEALNFSIEPYMGYGTSGLMTEKASADLTIPNALPNGGNAVAGGNITPLFSYAGFAFGMSAKVHFLVYYLGLEGSYAPALSVTKNNNTSALSKTNTNFKLGLTAGINLPVFPLSLWVGYQFLDSLDIPNYSATTGYTFNAGSFKIGAGYKILPFLKLNAEYFLICYGSTVTTTTTSVTTATPSNLSMGNNLFLLSLSVPVPLAL